MAMGRLTRSYRKAMTKLKFAVVTVLVVAAIVAHLAASPYRHYLWFILASLFLILVFKLVSRVARSRGKFVNSDGYFVLSESSELEHRHIAKLLLDRDLERNEVVHHINGCKTDNRVTNLCLMDREKHELFHSWLSWKRNKIGRYPSFRVQKRLLADGLL
jgi:hypothetical protein